MSIQTTSDNAILRQLGLNPGLLDDYFNVSMEPVKFEHIQSLGWGDRWQALHSCNFYGSDGEKGVVEGFEFTTSTKRTSFKQLMAKWEARRDCEADRKYSD